MLKALLEKRAALLEQMNALVTAAEAEDRDLTDDEQAQFDGHKAELESLEKRIGRAEEMAAHNETASQSRGAAAAAGGPAPTPSAPEASKEFETLGEFMATVARNPNDQRLAAMYQERQAAEDMSMSDGPRGGFMVPTQFLSEVQRVEPQDAIFRPRARVLPAGTPPDAAVTMPALDQTAGATGTTMRGGVDVTWVEEGGEKPKTDTKLRQVTLEPKEVTASMDVTDKLLRNWQAAGAFLQMLLRDAIINAEEDAFLSGNGVGKPLGLLNSGAIHQVARNTSSTILTADIDEMTSRLLMRGGAPVWLASQSTMPKLRALKDEQGNRIWSDSLVPGNPPTLGGAPVLWHERSPLLGSKGDLALVNLAYYLIKDGSGPFVAASEHVKFRENKTVFKIFWNVDGQPWLTAPIKQEKGYLVSPFVVLKA